MFAIFISVANSPGGINFGRADFIPDWVSTYFEGWINNITIRNGGATYLLFIIYC